MEFKAFNEIKKSSRAGGIILSSLGCVLKEFCMKQQSREKSE